MNKRTAAFFDIDGTLFRNSLLIEHFIKLTEDGILPKEIWTNEIGPLYEKYQNRLGAYEDYLDKAALVYQKSMIGLDRDIIEKYSKLVIEENKNKVYMVTRKAVENHKMRGDLIFFISGSPDFLVDHFANFYGATESISTDYVFDENNKFSGKVIPMRDGNSKLSAIKDLDNRYEIDLENSFSYGDTNGDITMFEMVGNPHAINPSYELINKLLSREELKEKAVINIERKDVNYNFRLRDMVVEFKKF